MKPLLNVKNDHRIVFNMYYHRLKARDDTENFYLTVCDLPIAFEEDWKTLKHRIWIHPPCRVCYPEGDKSWFEYG